DRVDLTDGVVAVAATDLSSGGFGQPAAVAREWSNGFGFDAAAFDGGSVVSGQVPYLRTDGTRVQAAFGGTQTEFFDYNPLGGTYAPRHMSKDALTQNAAAQEFTLATSAGAKLVFNNFDASLATSPKS